MPPLYGPRVQRNSQLDALAQALLNTDAREVRSPVEGVAKALTMGLGGYFAGQSEQKEKDRQKATADTYARALNAAKGWKNPDTGEMMMPPDRQAMISILAGNPDTAPSAMQLGLNDFDYNRARTDKLADTKDARVYQTSERVAGQDFTKGLEESRQAFAKAESELARAAAVASQNRSIEAQINLQRAQQAFTKAESALNRELTVSEGAANRSATAANAAASRIPPGFQATPDGRGMAAIPGGPADPAYIGQKAEAGAAAKPYTDEQAKAAGFADRMTEAVGVIDGLAASGWKPDMVGNALAGVAGGNMVASNERQKFEQAQRDFINAVLRRESGAVISESEFDNARKQYFPQPGDGAEVLAQKAKNRQTALDSMARSAGSNYKLPGRATTQTSGQSTGGGGSGGSLPKVNSPEDAMKLPKGTRFIDPNGVERVVP